jgi:hypothetical protein
MNNKELSKELMCLILRNGIEIWEEAERLEQLVKILLSNQKIGFVKINKNIINLADVVGIFTPETIDDYRRIKSGERKCKYGRWHEKGEKCECAYSNLSGEALARISRGW